MLAAVDATVSPALAARCVLYKRMMDAANLDSTTSFKFSVTTA